MDEQAGSLTVVAGTPAHRGFVRRLSAVAFGRFGAYDLTLPELFVSRGVRAWVVELDDVPVGFAMCSIDESLREGDLLAIAVESGAQRRGVGRRLLSEVEHYVARAFGAGRPAALRLTVAVDNAPARGLFTSSGYLVVLGEEGYYPGGQRGIVLRKPLSIG